MGNYFNTTKKRDIGRWIIATISCTLILFNFYAINTNYNELYEIERSDNDLKIVSDVSEYKSIQVSSGEIRPSRTLVLQHDITFNLLEICANLCVLVLIYAGRINIEGTKKE